MTSLYKSLAGRFLGDKVGFYQDPTVRTSGRPHREAASHATGQLSF